MIHPTLILNYPLLGINSYVILLKELREEDIKKIESVKELYLLIQLIGKYSYYLQIVSNDIENFCKEYLSDYIYEIYSIQEYIPDNFNPFGIKFKDTQRMEKKKDKKLSLDKYDYKLLFELSKNPLQSNLEISHNAKIDRNTVQKRVDKLLQSNVIQKFRYAADVFKYGFILYQLNIKTLPNLTQKVLSIIDINQFSGFRYKSFNTIFMSYIPQSHIELFSFIETLKELSPSIEIEVMQNTGKYIIETVPQIVKEYFLEKSK